MHTLRRLVAAAVLVIGAHALTAAVGNGQSPLPAPATAAVTVEAIAQTNIEWP